MKLFQSKVLINMIDSFKSIINDIKISNILSEKEIDYIKF